ncbi:hypothetical protein HYALB_00013008 [Hymenoscyphus albidus]|uniref:Heterokaryon incompatibility domain-containing protein n=1 Tax=Hymenoscyphus albidus TaxID=595503 RepID=A0A9N9LLV9_9HELO|nr:hypothetical protein HYALB_00013008 [Hymenoscyphus albidus]
MRKPLSLTVEDFRNPEIFSCPPLPLPALKFSTFWYCNDSIQYFISTGSIPQPAPFPYQPLDTSKHDIRLLQILPDLSTDGLIQCQLRHSTLSKASGYVALSYCWGDPVITQDIVVNGIVVPVTENLESALDQFQDPYSTSRRLWVDAICTNQHDLEEKGFQIQLMSRIYAEASEVLVWLGRAYGGWEAKFRFQKIIALARNDLMFDIHLIWSVIKDDYWQRVWIIQEITMGIKVWIKWYDVHKTITYNGDINQRRVKLIIDLKRFSDKEKISFFDAMVATRLSKSTELRDKVLGILGITADGQYILPTPSYVKSDFEINLEISSSLIRIYQEMLHHIFLWTELSAWTATSPKWIEVAEQGASAICTMYPALMKNLVVTTSTQTCLQLSGKRIGLVGECLLPCRPQYANHILQRILELIDLPYDTDATDDNIRFKRYTKRGSFAKYAFSYRWLDHQKDLKIGGHSLLEWASLISEPVTPMNGILSQNAGIDYHWEVRLQAFQRHCMPLFTASDGIIGLGPVEAKPGDYVFQLSGCVAILREHLDGYKLIGQAFVNVANYAKISTNEAIKATKVPGYLPYTLLPLSKRRKRRLGFGELLWENYEPDLTNLKEEEIKLY